MTDSVESTLTSSQLLRARLLIPPAVPDELERTALLERIAELRTLRVMVVTAPAGYGKTRLAAAVVRRLTDMQPAWLTLDSTDDRPDALLPAIAAALSPYLPSGGASIAQQLRPGHLLEAADLLLTLVAQIAQPMLLVLDDLHLLTESTALDLLSRLLAGSPPQLHWLLLSRHDVPLRLARRLLDADGIRLTRDDLRLDVAETAAYLSLQRVPPPDAQQLQILHERSDGWFAGLQCALLAWRRKTSAQQVSDLIGQLRGDQRLMSEYLMEELLARLPQRLAEFLLLCALPERLSPPLCDALTGGDDSALLLAEAEGRQLFLQSLDATGEWFVLHALWREFLLLEAPRRLPEQVRQAGAQRAAAWLAERGEIAAAVQVLVRSRQEPAAVALLVDHAAHLLIQHRLLELDQALRLLPTLLVSRSVPLLTARAWHEFLSERLQDLEQTLQLLEGFAEPDIAPFAVDLAVLRQLHLLVTADRRRIFSGLWLLRERLHGLAAGWGWLFLAIFFQPDLAGDTDVRTLFLRARLAFAQLGNEFGEISVRVLEVAPLRDAGRLTELAAECRDGLAYINRHATAVGAPDALIQLAMIGGEALFFMDRLPDAVDLLQRAYDEAQRIRNLSAQRKAALWLEVLRACGADVAGPSPLPQSGDWLVDGDFSSELLGNRAVLLYLTAMRCVVTDQGAADCRRALRVLAIDLAEIPPDRASNVGLAAALVRLAERDLDDALVNGLTAAAEQCQAQSLRHLQLQFLVVAALVARRLGRQPLARMVMRRVLVLLEQLPYPRLVLMFPELETTVRAVDHPLSAELCRRFAAQPTAARRLSEQEVRILRLLADNASQAEIAAALSLSLSTVKWYLHRLYREIGVKNRREAAAWVKTQL